MSSRPRPFADDAERALESLGTVRDFVRWGASQFSARGLWFGHGTSDAVDEAAGLVLHTLHLDAPLPDELWSAHLTPDEGAAVIALFRRRVEERIPAAYLTHEAWFAGLRFYVDPRVLIPRSPVAEWIQRGFDPWLESARVHRILDLGTGSGCIAIACASMFPDAVVHATDVDDQALSVAERNVTTHGLNSRVRVFQSDVFGAVPGDYDLIISNPPYVCAKELERLPPEYAHEPSIALCDRGDGLDCLRRILAGAKSQLNAGGILVVEAGPRREALEASYPHVPFTWLDLERGGENVFLLTAVQL